MAVLVVADVFGNVAFGAGLDCVVDMWFGCLPLCLSAAVCVRVSSSSSSNRRYGASLHASAVNKKRMYIYIS